MIGKLYVGTITNSYSTGLVTADAGGGLAGGNDGTVTDSFWDTETSGQATSNGGTGLTTAAMKRMAPFIIGGWNISQGEDLNNGYPYLAWQASNNSYIWLTPAEIPFVDGDGSSGNPYQIDSWIGLDAMRYGLDANYSLVGNLDSSSANYTGLGDSWEPIGECGPSWECFGEDYSYTFQGSFNGNGKTISNLSINLPGTNGVGLFGYVTGNISNVNLNIDNITGRGQVGGLVGHQRAGAISNSFSTITGVVDCNAFFGGLVGQNDDGTISNSHSVISGNVTISAMTFWSGGLVGLNSGNISDSSATLRGSIYSAAFFSSIAGLVGRHYSGSITNSSVIISDSAVLNGTINTGLIIGDYQGGTITSTYATVYDPQFGNITFLDWNVGSTAGGNLLDYIYINNNSAYVNGSISGLNKSANVSLYNLATTRADPKILKDGVVCTDCYNFTSLNAGNVTFNVTSWSNYSIKDVLAINNVIYSPNTTDDLDPGIDFLVNATVLNSTVDWTIDTVYLELYNGTGWTNYTTDNISAGVYSWSIPLLDVDTNYTFNIWANNSLGEVNYTANQTFNATWDCSFTILPANGSFGTIGGFNQERTLGNVTLNNTGDAGYNNGSGCNIKFGRTASGSDWYTTSLTALNFSTDYRDLNEDVFPTGTEPGGLRYYKNGLVARSVALGPKNSTIIEIKGIFPNIQNALNEYVYFPIFANVTDTTDSETNKTIRAKMVVTPGAYLENVIEQYTTSIPLTVGNYTFISYVKNVVSGADGVNNTAYNVLFNWTLPSDILERSSYTNLTYFNETLNDTNAQYLNFTLELNSSTLTSLTKGTKNIYTYAKGYENSTGILLPIVQGQNGTISNLLALSFACVEEADGICVNDCRTFSPAFGVYVASLDSDCGYCGNGIADADEDCSSCSVDVGVCPPSTGGSGGGGGGGAGGSLFEKSEKTFELVRGDNQYFELTLENKLALPKKDINIKITGNNSQYVSAEPSVITYLEAKSNESIKIRINAPSYFSSGKYLLQFEFKGGIVGNTTTPFTEIKYITLIILEMNRSEADGYVSSSLGIVDKMNSSSLKLDEVKNILDSMNSNYDSLNFMSLKDEAKQIEEIYTSATEYLKLKLEINQSMIESEKNGVTVSETKKLFLLAEILFNRGDYVAAYNKMKEAKTSFLLETKGEFKVLYYIKNNPAQSLAMILSLSLVGIGSGLLIRLRMYKRTLRLLAEEEELLLQLMKVVQRDCFENNKMSMEEYAEAMYQYEARLSNIIQEKVTTETLIANLMRIGGKKKALSQERDRLIVLVKQTQGDYMNRGKLDTRVYENMLRAYTSRISKIDEESVFIEAQEQIRAVSGFWQKWFGKK